MARTTSIICCLFSFAFNAVLFAGKTDPVMGKLTPLRTCFDVLHYDIRLKVEPSQKRISGQNTIYCRVVSDTRTMQLDFAEHMQVDSITMQGRNQKFKRKNNVIILSLPRRMTQKSLFSVSVFFSGQPHIAELAPWKGGFVWEKDSMGYDWVGLACEGIGASMWLPCKDHWSDEADSMDMHLTVPEALTGVSNGRLISESKAEQGFRTFHWQVRNPINNYNISINAGRYVHISDTFISAIDCGWTIYPPLSAITKKLHQHQLTLDYYVLSYNAQKAKSQFRQVHDMLKAFEQYFDPYPFYEDGYKLVETPFLGMEHQSCIAYGNKYRNNDFGFDFIIIHESGHEWFANSITADDPADMWIHESFTTYSEALYLEYMYNKETAIQYLEMQKKKIVSKEPMQGPRDVFYHGRTDSDIYYKGTWVLHTMRSICHAMASDMSASRKVNGDSMWFAVLKKFCVQFYHRTTNTAEVLDFFNANTPGLNWTPFFSQYIYSDNIPLLDYSISLNPDGTQTVRYQWKNTVQGFNMPVKIYTGKDTFIYVSPKEEVQELVIRADETFNPATELYLIKTR